MAQGDHNKIGEGYGSPKSVATIGDDVFLVSAKGALYRLNTKTGEEKSLSSGWKPLALVAHKGKLYLFNETGPIYLCSTESEDYEKVAVGWEQTTSAASVGDRLLAVANGNVYLIEV
jgi:hypothetical protein